jgi:hypothetical protein
VTYPGLRRLLGQPADTLDSIAASLSEHWRAAANSRPAKLFGTSSRSWLKVAMSMNVTPGGHHFTTGGRLIRYASGSASVAKPNRVPRS